ncbi:MAG TPA: tRNA (N6-threonylcarbamoyladenosine(37)-N6)-methyltransferase TrmO [Marinagarivorans sp.]
MEISSLSVTPIGVVRSCFTEKFGIPRQPSIATKAKASIELRAPYDDPSAVQGLEMASHIWVQFVFHANRVTGWKPKVKPPRLGGNRTMGVFATRSPTRPNPIGLSVVKLEAIDIAEHTACSRVLEHTARSRVLLHISGHDFLDGTPVLDIKPYVPYADCLTDATNQFAGAPPRGVPVGFSERALAQCRTPEALACDLQALVTQVLAQNPRPAYQKLNAERVYGMHLYRWNIRWRYLERNNQATGQAEEHIWVESISH